MAIFPLTPNLKPPTWILSRPYLGEPLALFVSSGPSIYPLAQFGLGSRTLKCLRSEQQKFGQWLMGRCFVLWDRQNGTDPRNTTSGRVGSLILEDTQAEATGCRGGREPWGRCQQWCLL